MLRVCGLLRAGLGVIASVTRGAGDGLQPYPDCSPRAGAAVSHAAIAAVLVHEELSAGERLAALSLASFANREHRAWPGTRAAAARAGLGKSGYLRACEELVRAGFLKVEDRGRGRRQARTFVLEFARLGPWWDEDVNAELVETVLSASSAHGSARVLLAVLAALADREGVVDGFTTEALCRVAGFSDTTYRRARRALLATGEVEMLDEGGGRGYINRWHIRRPAGPAIAPDRPRPAGLREPSWYDRCRRAPPRTTAILDPAGRRRAGGRPLQVPATRWRQRIRAVARRRRANLQARRLGTVGRSPGIRAVMVQLRAALRRRVHI